MVIRRVLLMDPATVGGKPVFTNLTLFNMTLEQLKDLKARVEALGRYL